MQIGVTELIAAIVTLLTAIGGGFAYLLNYFKPLIGATQEIQRLASVMQQDVSMGQRVSSELGSFREEMKGEMHAVKNEIRQQRTILKLLAQAVETCQTAEGCPAAMMLLSMDVVNPDNETERESEG
jgi:hypothetical protein